MTTFEDTPRNALLAALSAVGERAVYVRVEINDLEAALSEAERLRAAVTWFVDNAPVHWDEDLYGCRYCGTFDRSGKPHRVDCEYVKASGTVAS